MNKIEGEYTVFDGPDTPDFRAGHFEGDDDSLYSTRVDIACVLLFYAHLFTQSYRGAKKDTLLDMAYLDGYCDSREIQDVISHLVHTGYLRQIKATESLKPFANQPPTYLLIKDLAKLSLHDLICDIEPWIRDAAFLSHPSREFFIGGSMAKLDNETVEESLKKINLYRFIFEEEDPPPNACPRHHKSIYIRAMKVSFIKTT